MFADVAQWFRRGSAKYVLEAHQQGKSHCWVPCPLPQRGIYGQFWIFSQPTLAVQLPIQVQRRPHTPQIQMLTYLITGSLWGISGLDFKDLDELRECDGPTKLCAMNMGVCCSFAWFYVAEHLFTASILWGHICGNDVLTSSLTAWNIQWKVSFWRKKTKAKDCTLWWTLSLIGIKAMFSNSSMEFENRKKMK